jgi:hypothetical protein
VSTEVDIEPKAVQPVEVDAAGTVATVVQLVVVDDAGLTRTIALLT